MGLPLAQLGLQVQANLPAPRIVMAGGIPVRAQQGLRPPLANGQDLLERDNSGSKMLLAASRVATESASLPSARASP